MRLRLRRVYESDDSPQATPFILAFQIDLKGEEERWFNEYGAPLLAPLFEAPVRTFDLRFFNKELRAKFKTVTEAEQFEEQLKAACSETAGDWRAALAFGGEEEIDYPVSPSR